MAGSFTLGNLLRNPSTGKYESAYNGDTVVSIPNDGSPAPTIAVYQNWTHKAVGARAAKGVWDTALYAATAADRYPMYYNIDGKVGIGSRNNKTQLIYTVTVQNNAYYNCPVGGVTYSYTSSGAATASEIVTALSALINADTNCKAVASGTTTLILTRKNPAVPFYVNARDGGGNEIVYPNAGYSSAADAAGTGINLVSDNWLTGFIKYLSNEKRVFTAWEMGIPDGYYFSGAWEEETNPPQSTLKQGWLSDQGLDDLGRADVVSTSRNSPTGWAFVGNQSNINVPNGGQLDFGKTNTFSAYHYAGNDPFLDNGTAISTITGLAGTTVASQTTKPLFIRRTTITITAVNNFTYEVTINGTLCSYTSDASATQLEICNGLRDDINSKISNTVCVASNQVNILTIDPVERVLPTIVVGSNLSKFDLLPYFTQVSTIWHGNDNQVNCLHVYPWFYTATGDNCGNYVRIGNAATPAAVTGDYPVIPHTSWTTTGGAGGGVITISIPPAMIAGKTHWHRYVNGVFVTAGAL
jgi:hypothetical protein